MYEKYLNVLICANFCLFSGAMDGTIGNILFYGYANRVQKENFGILAS